MPEKILWRQPQLVGQLKEMQKGNEDPIVLMKVTALNVRLIRFSEAFLLDVVPTRQ